MQPHFPINPNSRGKKKKTFGLIGRAVRERRIKKDLSQKDLCGLLGFRSNYMIAQIEAGKIAPSAKSMKQLCHILDLDMNWIIEQMTEKYESDLRTAIKGVNRNGRKDSVEI